MKANISKSYISLSPSEKKKIERMSEQAYNRDVMIILDIYLKMSCAVVVRDQELQGKHYKKKTHFQAIVDMAMKDRKTK